MHSWEWPSKHTKQPKGLPNPSSPQSHIYIKPTPYHRLAKPPSTTKPTWIIRNLIYKEMNIIDSRLKKLNNSTMLKKWISNDQINHQLSNLLWKAQQTTDAQTTQIFKFKFSQYMRNHTNILFWSQSSLTGSNPNCTLTQSINKDTWPHLLSLCNHIFPQRFKNSKT